MLYHPGKVIEVFFPKQKNISSVDNSAQITVEMWDENILTFQLDNKLVSKTKEGDIVLVDYSPSSEKVPIPKHKIVKVLKGEKGKKMWEAYKEYRRKMKMQVTVPRQQPVKAKKSSQPYIG